ncbi:hypothetical protein J7M23_08655 [Candidatus Sumerlaeota bacterium]|nr:hypothetical protein [Candidatus Sumerlaeota bacterium]
MIRSIVRVPALLFIPGNVGEKINAPAGIESELSRRSTQHNTRFYQRPKQE